MHGADQIGQLDLRHVAGAIEGIRREARQIADAMDFGERMRQPLIGHERLVGERRQRGAWAAS